MQALVAKLVLADPASLAPLRRAQAKTDRHDAELLARLLFEGRLPTAFVPPRASRPLRDLVRHRHRVAKALARERRCLRWITLKLNPPGPKHLTSDATQKWLLAQAPKFSPTQQVIARKILVDAWSVCRRQQLFHRPDQAVPPSGAGDWSYCI